MTVWPRALLLQKPAVVMGRRMLRLVLQRLGTVIPTALLASIVVFSIVQFAPGGPAYAIAGPDATPEFVAHINKELGLDRPLPIQYLSWVGNLAQGSLGKSLVNRNDVGTLVAARMPVSGVIALEALLISMLIGVPLGIISAIRSGSLVDSGIRGFTSIGIAVPEFWLAMLAVNVFALQLFWLPPTGYVPPSAGLVPHLKTVVLPVLTLSLGPIAIIVRFMRSSMKEALSAPYIRTAWSLGLPASQIYMRFALKNALPSVITVIGIVASVLIGGAVLIESVFAIPGVGELLVQSVLSKDFPVVQGVTVILMFTVILINLIVDILVAAIDPRTR